MGKNKFTEAAKKLTTLPEVMTDRTKVTTREIKDMYPDGVTITEFDFVTLKNDRKPDGESTFPVFAIAEDPKVCFFGGEVLSRIAMDWADAYNGDIAAASADLKKSGGVKVKLTTATAKSGNNFTKVEILD